MAMRGDQEREYREYVAARLPRLRRTAYLLCRDWHAADDIVSITLTKLFRHWARARASHNLDAYVRGMLARAWLDERRRPWRREIATADPPDIPMDEAAHAAIVQRDVVMALLASLPPRQRAVVVLRYYCDLSVDETAEALSVSHGTVKSQSARGLDLLRAAARTYALEETR
jgi:RNA polymerase sigma-70 factor (sigma-E family)